MGFTASLFSALFSSSSNKKKKNKKKKKRIVFAFKILPASSKGKWHATKNDKDGWRNVQFNAAYFYLRILIFFCVVFFIIYDRNLFKLEVHYPLLCTGKEETLKINV